MTSTITQVDAGAASALADVTLPSPAVWAEARALDALALPEQSAEWIDAICSSGKFVDASRSYRFDDDRLFVLPLVRRRGTAGAMASLWSPPPAWGIGGLVGDTPDTDIVRAVVTDLRGLGAARIAVRIDTRHDEFWRSATDPGDVTLPRRSHVMDLLPTSETQLAGMPKSARYKIRRAARNGVRVEIDRTGALLDVHYDLFLRSVERWSGKQHEPKQLALVRAKRRDPLVKLQAMSKALGDRFLTIVSYIDDEPASSAIVLLGPTTRYTRGAMNIELAGPAFANLAVHWAAIEQAIAFGSARYHLGESGTSAGLSQFKEQLGAVRLDHHEYRFERLPLTAVASGVRDVVKRVIGFRD